MGSHGKSGHVGLCRKAKPFVGVIFLQAAVAGMEILSKVAMNEGMSSYVLIAYRIGIATVTVAPFAAVLERKARPKMTFPIFTKIVVLSLLEPVIDQNLYYLGMKYTSATFAATMCNIIPAVTFLMAWVVGLEKVALKNVRSQAKILGTVATVSGAMIMTLVKGPVVELFSSNGSSIHHPQQQVKSSGISLQDSIKGSIMIAVGCVSWSAFVILQAVTLKAYPAELSLTAWICMLGTIVDVIVALVMEKGRAHVWALSWDTKLIAILYTGTVSSGLLYYIQGVVMRERGPVFVTTFSPLSMVIVAVISFFILAEQTHLGRVIGAVVIVVGLYMVVWGKGKDSSDSKSSSSSIIKDVNGGGISDNSLIKQTALTIIDSDDNLSKKETLIRDTTNVVGVSDQQAREP